jgi:hypothetical protein
VAPLGCLNSITGQVPDLQRILKKSFQNLNNHYLPEGFVMPVSRDCKFAFTSGQSDEPIENLAVSLTVESAARHSARTYLGP